MNTSEVCGSQAFRMEKVSEVFLIEGRRVLINSIPARVCVRCQEIAFDRETTEIVRRMVHGEAKPMDVVSLEVFSYARAGAAILRSGLRARLIWIKPSFSGMIQSGKHFLCSMPGELSCKLYQ